MRGEGRLEGLDQFVRLSQGTSPHLKRLLEPRVVHVLDSIVVEVVSKRYSELRADGSSYLAHCTGDAYLRPSGVRIVVLATPVTQDGEHQRGGGCRRHREGDGAQEGEKWRQLHRIR